MKKSKSKTKALFGCYPGSKSKLVGYLPENLDYVWSPFLGSGVLELSSDAPCIYGDEIGAVRDVWLAAIDPDEWRMLVTMFKGDQELVRNIMSLGYDEYLALTPRKRRKLATGNAKNFLGYMDELTQSLADVVDYGDPGVNRAAAFYTLQKLTFSGYMRSGASSSNLNVRWVIDKFPSFMNFTPPESPLGNKVVALGGLDSGSMQWQPRGHGLAVIDPPYYGGNPGENGRMTPAYINHRPHSKETFLLMRDAVNRAVELEIPEIWVFNCATEAAHDFVSGLGVNYEYFDIRVGLNKFNDERWWKIYLD